MGLKGKIERIYIRVCDFCMFLASVGMLAALLLTFIQVVLRYVFSYSIQWAEETARYAMLCSMCLGLATTARLNYLPRVDIIYNRLPPKAQYYLNYLFGIVIIGVTGMLAYHGIKAAENRWRMTGITLKISMGILYAFIPLCAVLLLFDAVIKILNNKPPEKDSSKGGA